MEEQENLPPPKESDGQEEEEGTSNTVLGAVGGFVGPMTRSRTREALAGGFLQPPRVRREDVDEIPNLPLPSMFTSTPAYQFPYMRTRRMEEQEEYDHRMREEARRREIRERERREREAREQEAQEREERRRPAFRVHEDRDERADGASGGRDRLEDFTIVLRETLREISRLPKEEGTTRQRKIAPFSSGAGSDWLVWKKQFNLHCKMAKWDDLRQRQELFTAMEGKAAKVVADIEVEVLPSIEWALEMYEDRFATRADSQLAKSEFTLARQTDDESILEWHARLRELFLRAYPGVHVDSTGMGDQLREMFISGLKDPEVSAYVWDKEAKTYNRALVFAEVKRAIQLKIQGRSADATTPKIQALQEESEEEGEERMVAAFYKKPGARDYKDGNCHICHQAGHLKRACPSWKNVMGYFRKVGLFDRFTSNRTESPTEEGRVERKTEGLNHLAAEMEAATDVPPQEEEMKAFLAHIAGEEADEAEN